MYSVLVFLYLLWHIAVERCKNRHYVFIVAFIVPAAISSAMTKRRHRTDIASMRIFRVYTALNGYVINAL